MTLRFMLSVAALTVIATPVFAEQFRFTANGQIVSDYRNRGISRSDEGGALQGRAEVEHISGVYAGIGASSVDLDSDPDANVEGIIYGGYKGNYDGIEYDAKLGYTAYPGGDNNDMDYAELKLTGGYDFDVFYGSMTWAFSPDYIAGSGASFYYGGDVSVPVRDNISVKGHLGYQYVANEGSYVTDNVIDWSLGGWYNYAPYNIDVGLEYVDTDLEKAECVDKCGARGVLTLSKSLSW